MGVASRVCNCGGSLLDLVIRIVLFPFTVLSWIVSLLPLIFVLGALFGIGVVSYVVVARNGDVLIERLYHTWGCTIVPFYERFIRPIFVFIHNFYNPIICWWDGLILWPQTIGREVIFPVFLDCGLLDMIVNLGNLFVSIFQELLVGYIASFHFLDRAFDGTRLCAAWQTFFLSWQQLLCCGCNDLCKYLVNLPMIPMAFTSNQLRDDQFWCALNNTFNGALALLQEIWRIIRLLLFGGSGSLRPSIRKATDFFCAAIECFFKSWENALQDVFDTFVPFEFVWRDVLCPLGKIMCVFLRLLSLIVNIIAHGDLVIDHFRDIDSTYWINNIKEDVKEILNLWTTATPFDPIAVVLPDSSVMEITHYSLSPYDEAAPSGNPNPVYSKQLVSDCICIAMTRIFCDRSNNGTTCAQKFNGTLLQEVDVCCAGVFGTRAMVDMTSFLFEATLHLDSSDNFFMFLDRQPFSGPIKDSIVITLGCVFDLFRIVKVYGACVDNLLTELVFFVASIVELAFKVILGLITLPFFRTQLPAYDNFLTKPGDEALQEAIGFLDRVGDTTNPGGLINCMCFLVNSAFSIPLAGCANQTCTPTGFLPPPVPTGGGVRLIQFRGGTGSDSLQRVARSVVPQLQNELNRVAAMERAVVTSAPINVTVDCGTCFNGCCTPSRIVLLLVHISGFSFRAFNAAFQSRFGSGSTYWNGANCTMDPLNGQLQGTCLASDAILLFNKLSATLTCLCNFVQLLIPPMPGIDPCCLFTLAGDLLSGAAQILINVANSLAGDPQYRYLKDSTMLTADFRLLGDVAIRLFACACDAIRVIIQFVQDAAGVQLLSKTFDPCCVPQKLFTAAIGLVNIGFRIILSLATLEEQESQCYLFIQDLNVPYRASCPAIGVNNLTVVREFDAVLAILFAAPKPSSLNNLCVIVGNGTMNQATEGISTCYCSTLQSVMAIIFDPALGLGSCPLNLCCAIYRFGEFVESSTKFSFRLILSVFQSWTANQLTFHFPNGLITSATFNIPAGLIDFFFCDEYFPGGSVITTQLGGTIEPSFNITNPYNRTASGYGSPTVAQLKCGQLEPVLGALLNLVTTCVCSTNPLQGPGVGDIVDDFLEWLLYFIQENTPDVFGLPTVAGLFHWPRCLCQGGRSRQGVLKPLANVIVVGARQIIILLRNIPNPSYWNPVGGSFATATGFGSTLVNNVADIERTWIARFLGPFADSLCDAVSNLACFLSLILGQVCVPSRYNVVSSAIHYLLEAVIKALVLLEGFLKLFLQEAPGLCVGNQAQVQGGGQVQGSGVNGASSDGNSTFKGCNPGANVGSIYGLANDMTERLTTIAVSTSQFIVDALIGVSIFTCTKICPVQPGGFTLVAGIPSPMGLACSCYENSPYKAGAVLGSTLEACRYALDLPLNEPVCPGKSDSSASTACSYNEACGNPPDTGFIVVETENIGILGATNGGSQFICNRSLSAGLGNLVSYPGSGIATGDRENAFEHWIRLGPFGVVKAGGQPNGCVFSRGQINDFGNFTDPALGGYESTIERQHKGVVYKARGFTGWIGDPTVNGYEWKPTSPTLPFAPNGYCQLTPRLGFPPVTEFVLKESFSRFGPGFGLNSTRQPLCTRDMCVTNGFCKNDQMGPCSKDPPYQPPLDGIAMSILKYLKCLLEDQSDKLEIPAPFMSALLEFWVGILNVVIGIVSVVWQLSAGIIKFLISMQVALLKFLLDFNPFTAIFSLLFYSIIALFNFFAIFAQPVIPQAGPDVAPFSERRRNHIDPQAALMEQLRYAFGGGELSNCVADPMHCLCIGVPNCGNNGTSIANVLAAAAALFNGETGCDTLVQHWGNASDWEELSLSNKYIYMDCIAKRVQGSRIHTATDGTVPEDFFYSPDGWYKLATNVANRFRAGSSSSSGGSKRDDSNRFDTRLRNFDVFVRQLQARVPMAERVVEERLGIPRSSPAFEFTVEMDRFWFKYRSGYYHFLGENAWDKVRNEGLSSFLGSYSDVVRDLWSSVHEVRATYHALLKPQSEPEPDPEMHHRTAPPSPWSYRLRSLSNSSSESARDLGARLSQGVGSLRNLRLDESLLPDLTPTWTEDKADVLFAGKRFLYHMLYAVAPHLVSREARIKFILNFTSCRLVEGIVRETAGIVSFCMNEYNYTLPTRVIQAKYGSNVRSEMHLGRHRLRWVGVGSSESTALMEIHPATYRRATRDPIVDMSSFDLIQWLSDRFEDITGIRLLNSGSTILRTIKEWITNPNTDYRHYPDVGALFYVRFALTCRFPENVACMFGIGLEQALIKVTIAFAIGIAALWALGLLSTAALLVSPVIYFSAVMVVAYHWTPICAYPFPSFLLPGGISIPFIPIPIGPWALPMCLWDDVFALFDKYLKACLDFIIPQALVAGPVCPACPNMIDFINCRSIGIGDGASNVLFLLYDWFGETVATIFIGLGTSRLGRIWPGLADYLIAKFRIYRTASPTLVEQLRFCSYFSLPSILILVPLAVVLFSFLFYVLVPLYGLVVSGIRVLRYTHVAQVVVNQGEPTEDDQIPGEPHGQDPIGRGAAFIQKRLKWE